MLILTVWNLIVYKVSYLNTSNVNVNLQEVMYNYILMMYLNTSNVNVNLQLNAILSNL